jgi:RNA polymerase sigma-70 factor, ECF subfamily
MLTSTEAALNDQSILSRIRSGEVGAFAQWVDRYQRPLFGYLGRMGLSQAQAEDIAQEAFLRAWIHLHAYAPARAKFSTWLFTIARNLAINASASSRHEISDASFPEPSSDAPGPEQLADDAQQRARLQAALRQIPTPERSALALAYVHELQLVDIARIEGDSLAAIKTRIHRAKQRLRSVLEPRD